MKEKLFSKKSENKGQKNIIKRHIYFAKINRKCRKPPKICPPPTRWQKGNSLEENGKATADDDFSKKKNN